MDRFEPYDHGEGRTGTGQLVEFTCPVGAVAQAKAFIGTMRSFSLPHTRKVNVSHGGYGRYSRYDIAQHDYAGGGPGDDGGWGFIEVLEIRDPPDGRHGIVIHESGSHMSVPGGSAFIEWDTLEDAKKAFKKSWSARKRDFAQMRGFRRRVECGALTPWFYAVGEEELQGDFALPSGIEDDPVYRIGRRFVVEDGDGRVEVKTCVGCRYVDREAERSTGLYGGGSKREREQFRIIYWDDGTCHNEYRDGRSEYRPLEDDELWIVDAIDEFKAMLSGKKTEFAIRFNDGSTFTGRLRQAGRKGPTAEGKYFARVLLKNGEVKEGWVDFKPTASRPDIVTFITWNFEEMQKKPVERVEITRSKDKAGKKWVGVYHSRRK